MNEQRGLSGRKRIRRIQGESLAYGMGLSIRAGLSLVAKEVA